jgi:hypothetical protein
MIRLHAHPLPPSPVTKLYLFLSLSMCVAGRAYLTEGRGGEAKSYDGEKAWSSINHSILPDTATHLRLNNNLKELISVVQRCRGTIQQGL